jgi:hypothetical protein
MFFVKFITQAKDLCVFFDGSYKKIRKYKGDNSFLLSLQKNLRNSRNYFENNKKKYKILSEKQYLVAESLLNE